MIAVIAVITAIAEKKSSVIVAITDHEINLFSISAIVVAPIAMIAGEWFPYR